MIKLTDTQAILLSHASQQASGSLLPPKPGGGTAKAIDALVTRGLAEERETSVMEAARRTDGDVRFGVFITDAGLVAINAGEEPSGSNEGNPTASAPAAAPATRRASKADAVLTLLRRESGATLPELIEATGWLPHTTRAALTGLRKKGHAITRGKRGETTCYTLTAAQA